MKSGWKYCAWTGKGWSWLLYLEVIIKEANVTNMEENYFLMKCKQVKSVIKTGVLLSEFSSIISFLLKFSLSVFNIENYAKDENVKKHIPFKVQEYNFIFIKLCLYVMLKIHRRMKMWRTWLLFPPIFNKDLVVPQDQGYDYNLS